MDDKVCPDCGLLSSDTALKCDYCGYEFASGEMKQADSVDRESQAQSQKPKSGTRLYAERFGLGAISCSITTFLGWSRCQAVNGMGWDPDVEMVLISLVIGIPLGGISGLLFGRKDKKAAIIAGFVAVIVPILMLFLCPWANRICQELRVNG